MRKGREGEGGREGTYLSLVLAIKRFISFSKASSKKAAAGSGPVRRLPASLWEGGREGGREGREEGRTFER